MSMSKDRVRFTLSRAYFEEDYGRKRGGIMREVLHEAFGVNGSELDGMARTVLDNTRVVIQCRPSQFARFLILREKAGFQNMFKELNAELIQPEPVPLIWDYSRNPA